MQGQMPALSVSDASVDIVVCGLALAHLEDLAPVYAEFEGLAMTINYVPNLVPLPTDLGLGEAHVSD